jgi:hypothetical protein
MMGFKKGECKYNFTSFIHTHNIQIYVCSLLSDTTSKMIVSYDIGGIVNTASTLPQQCRIV